KMISLRQQRGENAADGFNRLPRVRSFQSTATIVKTDYRTIFRVCQNTSFDLRRSKLPVAPDNGPHDALQLQSFLHLPKSEPAHPVGRTHKRRRAGGDPGDRVLRPEKFLPDKIWTCQSEIWVRVGMVAEFVRPGTDRLTDLRRPAYVDTALKECGRGLVSSQN